MTNLRQYSQFIIPKDYINKSKDSLCNQSKFVLQSHQAFLRQYINNNLETERFLIYHEKGSGKTCTAISIAEKFNGKVIVISPAGLIQNFIAELKGPCAKKVSTDITQKYIFFSFENFHKLIDKGYTVSTHDRHLLVYFDVNLQLTYYYSENEPFTNATAQEAIQDAEGHSIGKFLTVIDEAHNLFYSPTGAIARTDELFELKGTHKKKKHSHAYFNSLITFIQRTHRKTTILFMTATPIFDNATELGPLLKALVFPYHNNRTVKGLTDTFIDPKTKRLVTDIKRQQTLKEYLQGKISYFSGGHPNAYPKFNVSYHPCLMISGSHQQKKYFDLLDKQTNIHFGLEYRKIASWSLYDEEINKDYLNRENLEQYSCKFYTILNSLLTEAGSFFVYSNFKKFGIDKLADVLQENRFDLIAEDAYDTVFQTKSRRFALITGDTDQIVRQKIIELFNDPRNYRGEYIKALLGSAALKEGVSLKNVRIVYILEPHWNNKRTSQVLGRAIRYCSHKNNPNPVDVRILVAVTDQLRLGKKVTTIDEDLIAISDQKELSVSSIETLFKNISFDCQINWWSHFARKGSEIVKENLRCVQSDFSQEELETGETLEGSQFPESSIIIDNEPKLLLGHVIQYLQEKYT